MAGGTFLGHNKVRPGAYINFKAVARPASSIGTRGIVTMPMPMAWGAKVTELYSTDLVDGRSRAKIGYTALDEESLIYREALKNCYKAVIYRLDTGGTRASIELAPVTVTAKYAGIVGNDISVVVENKGDKYDVATFFKGAEQDRQTVDEAEQLIENDWVVFSGTGSFSTSASGTLEGGTNGTVATENYADYLAEIRSHAWNTMGIPQESPQANDAVVAFIGDMRENFGRKVQAVLYNADVDYEGIITTMQGYKTNTEEISPTAFVAYVAGMTAGADVNTSNTYHEIEGAVSIIYPAGVTPFDGSAIEQALQEGKMILSTRQDGAIVIEQDINTLHTYDSEKNYSFSKNRVIRTLDEINNTIALLFERNYIGKVDNNDDGRNIFKADVIAQMYRLQNVSAIQNFDSSTDIEVYAGETIDSVVVDLAVQPVDSMEKLYMTVLVG